MTWENLIKGLFSNTWAVRREITGSWRIALVSHKELKDSTGYSSTLGNGKSCLPGAVTFGWELRWAQGEYLAHSGSPSSLCSLASVWQQQNLIKSQKLRELIDKVHTGQPLGCAEQVERDGEWILGLNGRYISNVHFWMTPQGQGKIVSDWSDLGPCSSLELRVMSGWPEINEPGLCVCTCSRSKHQGLFPKQKGKNSRVEKLTGGHHKTNTFLLYFF